MSPALMHAIFAALLGLLAGGYVALFYLHRQHAKILHDHTMSLMVTAANYAMVLKALEVLASRGLPEGVSVSFDIDSDAN